MGKQDPITEALNATEHHKHIHVNIQGDNLSDNKSCPTCGGSNWHSYGLEVGPGCPDDFHTCPSPTNKQRVVQTRGLAPEVW